MVAIHSDKNRIIQKSLQRSIKVARGLEPADLVLRNARIINVFSGDIHQDNVAVADGVVVGIGDYEGKETIDLAGAYLAPGFVEGHIHIESSMLTPVEFARAVIPHGTTTVVADPHELANVLGLDGIDFMIEQSLGLPMTIYFMIPSCVPSSPLETSGSALSAREIHYFVNEENVLGLGEVMNFPGVLEGDPQILAKLIAANGIQNPRSIVVATYALCGFAHVASLAIFIGGISTLAPKRIKDLSELGFRALLGATLACLMTACVAGMFFTKGSILLGR